MYCHMVVTATYLEANRPVIEAINWFRFHGVQVKARPPDAELLARWHFYLARALKEDNLEHHGMNLVGMAGHLNFVLINRLMSRAREGRSFEPHHMRPLVRMFLHGIKGVKET